jgi:hypothetical protein
MDNVLVPYLTARDEQQRQEHLAELVTVRAAPVIRQVLRHRLGLYVSAQGVNENNQDAEDLYQEAMMRVVQVLNQLQGSSGNHIERTLTSMFHALLQTLVQTSFALNPRRAPA